MTDLKPCEIKRAVLARVTEDGLTESCERCEECGVYHLAVRPRKRVDGAKVYVLDATPIELDREIRS